MNEVSVGQEYYDRRFRGDGHSPRGVSVVAINATAEMIQIKNNYTGRKVWLKAARLANKSRFALILDVLKPSPEAVPA